jgi:hypothetical protein
MMNLAKWHYQDWMCLASQLPNTRFLNGTTEERNKMLKLIPHIADGSWMIKQSVGSTPVILGKVCQCDNMT